MSICKLKLLNCYGIMNCIHTAGCCVHAQYPANLAERQNRWEIPALISARIWLGLEKYEHEWRRVQKEGEIAVFAETVS